MPIRVLIRGAGDLATGVAVRLFRSGLQVVMTELANPIVVRRGAAFADAVFNKACVVEGIQGKLSTSMDYQSVLKEQNIPVLIDEDNLVKDFYNLDVLIDARMLKSKQSDNGFDSVFVIGLGPGFTVDENCHVVIETKRGHDLGKVILEGQAALNTSIPGDIAGKGAERVLRTPILGLFTSTRKIGELVAKGDEIATVEDIKIISPFDGVIRGLIASGIIVKENMKIGDVDPRGNIENCFTVSDKARAIGGGVLEAILSKKIMREKLNQK